MGVESRDLPKKRARDRPPRFMDRGPATNQRGSAVVARHNGRACHVPRCGGQAQVPLPQVVLSTTACPFHPPTASQRGDEQREGSRDGSPGRAPPTTSTGSPWSAHATGLSCAAASLQGAPQRAGHWGGVRATGFKGYPTLGAPDPARLHAVSEAVAGHLGAS